MTTNTLPNPGSPEASAMIDSLLAEYHYPANPKNAARAGYEAARRMLASAPAQPVAMTDERAAFEDAYRKTFPNLTNAVSDAGIFERHATESNTYAHTLPLVGWGMWQARAAQVAPKVPEFTSLCGRVTLTGPREDVEHLVRLLPDIDDAPAQPVAMTDERMSLISRLKAQSVAHRYEAETDSADLIDEGVAALSAMTDLLEEARDTIAKLLIKIRRDAPDSAGRLLGYADQVVDRVDAALDSPLSAQAAPKVPEAKAQAVQLFSPMYLAPLDGTPVLLYMPTTSNKFSVGKWLGSAESTEGCWCDEEGYYYLHEPAAFMALGHLEQYATPQPPIEAQEVPEGDDISLTFAVQHALNVLQDVHMYGGSDLGPSMWQQVANAIEFCDRALAAAPQPASSEPFITKEEIDRIAELTEKAMEDGLRGFCKTWGWQQFARTLVENLRPYSLRVSSPQQEERKPLTDEHMTELKVLRIRVREQRNEIARLSAQAAPKVPEAKAQAVPDDVRETIKSAAFEILGDRATSESMFGFGAGAFWAVKALEPEAPQPPAPASDDVRELRKWLNEEPSRPLDRAALARVLHAAGQPPATSEQRKPLTDEEVRNLQEKYVGTPSASYPITPKDFINFARAIECAHGIRSTGGEHE